MLHDKWSKQPSKTFHSLVAWSGQVQQHAFACSVRLYIMLFKLYNGTLIYFRWSGKASTSSPAVKMQKLYLPLVTIQPLELSKENAAGPWAWSLDRLELPPRPLHYSNSSGSFCFSESGSRYVYQAGGDIKNQLEQPDETIVEKQSKSERSCGPNEPKWSSAMPAS